MGHFIYKHKDSVNVQYHVPPTAKIFLINHSCDRFKATSKQPTGVVGVLLIIDPINLFLGI